MTINVEISPALLSYLKSWHETSCARQRAKGVTVDLSFQDFADLFTQRQMATLQKSMDAQRIRYLMDEANPYAFVLTWKSYAARSSNIFDKTTATVCSRIKSKQINSPQKGDTLRAEHKAKISKKLTGKPKSDDHRAAMSESATGSKKAGWSPERKAARSAQRKAQEAAKQSKQEIGL